MITITCKLFGTPEILKNGEKIIFPYKKAEALFYYLMVKKQCFRDTLVELLWGSVEVLREAIFGNLTGKSLCRTR